VFSTDNPVERPRDKAAFPEIRCWGPNPYLWRPHSCCVVARKRRAPRSRRIRGAPTGNGAETGRAAAKGNASASSGAEFLAALDGSARRGPDMCEIDRLPMAFPGTLELCQHDQSVNTTGKRCFAGIHPAFFSETAAPCFVLDVPIADTLRIVGAADGQRATSHSIVRCCGGGGME